MSALLKQRPDQPHIQNSAHNRSHLRLVVPSERRAADLAISPLTYKRRRLMAASLAVLAIFTVWYLANGLFAFVAGGNSSEPADSMQIISATHPAGLEHGGVSSASSSSSVAASDNAQYVTVRPGDTLWTIAQAVQPKGDIRPVLNRLAKRYGDMPLVPGTNIVVS